MKPIKVASLHLLPAPYRMPLFERLLRDESLDVRLFFTDKPSWNRPTWSTDVLPKDRRVTRLPEVALPFLKTRGDTIHINFGLSKIFDWKPDVVLVYGYNDLTTMLTALLCIVHRIPFVVFAEVSNGTNWSLLRRVYLPLLRVVIPRAAWLVPASKSCARFFEEVGGRPESMTIIPCVPDIAKMFLMSNDIRGRTKELKREKGLENKFVLLFVGRFVENKGIREILQATKGIAETAPDVTLVVIGYGPLEILVRDEAKRMGETIRIVGFVDDKSLYEYYSIADLHIMPSWDEPYGVVCPEALSFGLPSIVTDTSGCIDLIVEGVNGSIIKPHDPKGIEISVLRVYKDRGLHSQMRVQARKSVERLTMDYLYSLLKEVILSAVKSGGNDSGDNRLRD